MAGADPRSRRLFFSLWPTAQVRSAITATTRELVDRSGGRAVQPQNLHVTLAFLGTTPESSLEAIRSVGASLVVPRFDLMFDKLATWSGAGVLVLTVDEIAPDIAALVESLRFNLLAQQVNFISEEFRPHVTLARKISRSLDATIEPVIWPVCSLVLVESKAREGAADYEIIECWTQTGETV